MQRSLFTIHLFPIYSLFFYSHFRFRNGMLSKYTAFLLINESCQTVFNTMKVKTGTLNRPGGKGTMLVNGKVFTVAATTTSKTGKHGHAKVLPISYLPLFSSPLPLPLFILFIYIP
jgi:hypothetical protein